MNTIDLHNLNESEAISATLTAFLSLKENEQLEIITGNGIVLKDVVLELINEENLNYKYENNNFGSIIVWK